MFFMVLLCVMLIILDQVTKYLAFIFLQPIGSFNIIPKILNLTYVENRGAAFGIFQGGRWFFVVMTTAVLVGIFFYYRSLPKTKAYRWVRFSLILISCGAVGNNIDRLRNGYVVDFFHTAFMDFPVFNMADIYVVTGTILLAVLMLFFIKDDETVKEISPPLEENNHAG